MEFGSVTDWLSAASNITMAAVAIYAARNAKDWLSPKLNERKFKFADEIINGFCNLQQEAFLLHSEAKKIINTNPDEQRETEIFFDSWDLVVKNMMTYRKNAIILRTQMERMVLWGLQPLNINEFEEVINSHLQLSYTIDSALSIGPKQTNARLNNCLEYDRQISEKYISARALHNGIMKHYSKLFVS